MPVAYFFEIFHACLFLEVRVKAQPEFKWLKANMNSDNYYIVNYDKQTWHGIIKQLKTDHEVGSNDE